MKWDIMDITLPWSHFISECIRSGDLPLWNPYLNNGFPMMGLPDTWYPITWIISLIFGMDIWSIQMDYLLHLFIGAYGTYRYCLFKKIDVHFCFALAVCYMFSGYMIGNAQHLGWIIGGAWLPWVFHYFDRLIEISKKGDILKLALVSSLLFYGAYPPITIIVFYILLVKLLLAVLRSSLTKKTILPIVLSFLVFLAISCIGLIGMIDITPHLNRGGQLPLSDTGWGVLTGFLPTEAISSLIVPYAGTAVKGFWGSDISLINCYLGFLPLLFLLFGLASRFKRTWRYSIVGFFFLLIAMSELTPFRAWLYHLPLFDKFRFPSLFRLFAIFFFLIASGFAYTELKEQKNTQRKLKLFLSSVLGLLCCWFMYLWFSNDLFSLNILLDEGLNSFNIKSSFRNKASLNILIHILMIGSLLCYLVRSKEKWKYVPLILIVEILIISQLNISETVIHFGDPKIGNKEIKSYRSKPMDLDLTKSMNTFNDGYWKEQLTWFRFNQASITKTPSADGNSPFSLLKSKQAKENGDIALNEYPLIFFADVENEKVVESRIVENSIEFLEVIKLSNNEFEIETNYPKRTNLIFLQNKYPGWRTIVNDKECEIQLVNTTFMSIPLEPGTQNVKLQFRPAKIIYSFYLSLIAFLLVISGTVYYQFQKEE